MSSAECTLRIVGVGGGRPEERVDGVADVFLDDTAFRGDEGLELREAAIEGALQPFGPELAREGRRTDDVDEQRRDDATFHGRLGHRSGLIISACPIGGGRCYHAALLVFAVAA